MAAENFERALAEVFGHEGGYTADLRDAGNWTSGKRGVGQLKGTKYGISAAAFPYLDIKNLTVKQAGEIYRERYWKVVGGDTLEPGVDLAVFDAAVNSGVSRARKWYASARTHYPIETVKRLCDMRRSFVQGLSSFRVYGKGWLSRIARIEAVGTRWVLEQRFGLPAQAVKKHLTGRAEEAAAKSAETARQAKRAGGGTVVINAAVGATDTGLEGSALVLTLTAILLMGGLIAALALHRSRAKREAAKAYAEQAALL